LEQLRKVLGLESIKDAAGNIIQEAPLPVWANLRQRKKDFGSIGQNDGLIALTPTVFI
jgi:hypothetical protein